MAVRVRRLELVLPDGADTGLISTEMKLTTTKILEYYEAFTRIDGYARMVEVNGRQQIVIESFDLSPKVKWLCVVNKTLLRPYKEAAETMQKAEQDKFNATLKEIDPAMDKDEAQKILKVAENECNARLAAIIANETDINGLVKLPGVGIRIRGRDPGIIGILTSIAQDFVEGTPDYGQKPEAQSRAAPPEDA